MVWTVRNSCVLVLVALCACAPGGGHAAVEIPRPESWKGFEPLVRERIESALNEVEQARGSETAWCKLGMTYHANDLIDLAAPCYEQSLGDGESDGLTLYLLARVRTELGDIDAAVDVMERCRELLPEVPSVRWRLGLLHLDRGELDAARAEFEAARTLDAEDPAALVGLARVDFAAGAFEAVAERLEQLLSSRPRLQNQLFVRDLLGRALQNTGRSELAESLIAREGTPAVSWPDALSERLYELRVISDWLISKAHSQITSGAPEAGLETLSPLLEYHSEDPMINKMLGMAYFALGDSGRAVAALERVLAETPNDFSAYLNIGLAHERAEEWADAERFSKRAVQLNPDSLEARMQHARTLFALGRFEDGLPIVVRVTEERPEWGGGWFWLARLRGELGELDAARVALDKAGQFGINESGLRLVRERLAVLTASADANQ